MGGEGVGSKCHCNGGGRMAHTVSQVWGRQGECHKVNRVVVVVVKVGGRFAAGL